MQEGLPWAQASSVMLLMLYDIDFLNIKYPTHFQKIRGMGQYLAPFSKLASPWSGALRFSHTSNHALSAFQVLAGLLRRELRGLNNKFA